MPDQVRHDGLGGYRLRARSFAIVVADVIVLQGFDAPPLRAVTPDLIRGPPSSSQRPQERRWMPDQVRHDGLEGYRLRARSFVIVVADVIVLQGFHARPLRAVTPDLIRGPPASSQRPQERRWMPDQVRHDGLGGYRLRARSFAIISPT
jgi:hypothetical protein